MSDIRIHTQDGLVWMKPAERVSAEEAKHLTEGERTVEVAIHEPGTDEQPQLLEIRYEPHALIQPHAHAEDEIIFVRAGELHFGTRTLRAGDSLYIPGRKFYSFQAGPDGLQILNFRPKKDQTFYTHDKARKSVV